MKAFFHLFLVGCSRRFGNWFFTLISGGIAFGYFLLSGKTRSICIRFYKTLFPGKGTVLYLWYTWRQFQGFTHVFMDRLLPDDAGITYTFDGLEHLKAVLGNTGGILLMSHMGNWEVAARLLKKDIPELDLLLYMGVRDREQIEKIQKNTVTGSGIRIIGVDEKGGSPMDIVEGIRFLKNGGVVSLTGDRIWRPEQKQVRVRFLGKPAQIPRIPYVLSLVSGAPLIIFFALRTGNRRYRFFASPPIYLDASKRQEREKEIYRAARVYADQLEKTLKAYPFQWHHFQPFLGDDQM